ncbi:MAG: translocation/assembly module TamB domain-containing protein, partial [Pseudomonadota bacterium]
AGAGVDLRAALRGGSDLAADLVGQVPFDLADPVSLALDLTRLDIRILDAVAGNLGLQGVVTGRADVSGPASAPVVEFDIASSGLTSEAVREAGLSAVTIGAEGRFEDDTVILSDVTAQSGGARAAVAGEVRLAREELDLAFDLALPLALANPFLARQAVQVSGTLTAGGRVAGPFRGPAINGRISAAGATLVDPLRNLRIDGIALGARLAGRELLISELSGTVAAGGQVSGSGRVGLDRGLPADLDLRLENVRFTDGEIIDTVASGEIFVTGPITAQPLVSGDIRIGTTEIAIPSSFGIREGVLLDVAHQNLPADVELTLDRAGLREEQGARPGRAGTRGVRLDIAISAPNRMFVRGRGLDAEMGGNLRVRGTTGDLAPQGQIELIRGRIGILGQRIDFTEGAITATGDVNVRLRLVAETEVDDTQITLIVQGRATDPELVLTSSPSLPEDEILALLIFRRELATLSPLQVAQLASAAATLTGQGGGGLVSQFRSGAGLSNLDVTTGDEGEVGVRAGAYLSENVYLDLEAESDGDARATINIDITRTLRGRVSVDNDGEGQVGIFYERDY